MPAVKRMACEIDGCIVWKDRGGREPDLCDASNLSAAVTTRSLYKITYATLEIRLDLYGI